MDPAFWSNRKVLVTGHTGFKGSWLCLWLEHVGAKVVGYSLDPPTQPSLFELANVSRGIVSIRGDVRDVPRLSNLIREHQPDVIFHLAAQSIVRESYTNPVETYSTNVLGTVGVLEAARCIAGRRSIVNVTTDKCYRNREWLWGYRETDELGGHDPYSNSKACAELVTSAYRESFFPASSFASHGVGVATARAGNVIGGGDWTRDQLIPDAVRAFTTGNSVLIRSPRSVRPWQHVIECLGGYLVLAEKLVAAPADVGTSWNFGPDADDTRTVEWIVDMLARLWGPGASWRLDGGAHPHESRLLRLDSTRAAELLGWKTKLTIEDALTWTANWYKAYYAGGSARDLCLQQIKAYLDL